MSRSTDRFAHRSRGRRSRRQRPSPRPELPPKPQRRRPASRRWSPFALTATCSTSSKRMGPAGRSASTRRCARRQASSPLADTPLTDSPLADSADSPRGDSYVMCGRRTLCNALCANEVQSAAQCPCRCAAGRILPDCISKVTGHAPNEGKRRRMPNAAPNYRWDHIHLRSPDPDATAAWFRAASLGRR